MLGGTQSSIREGFQREAALFCTLKEVYLFNKWEKQEVGRRGRRGRALARGHGLSQTVMLLPYRSARLQHQAQPEREREERRFLQPALRHACGIPDGRADHQVLPVLSS